MEREPEPPAHNQRPCGALRAATAFTGSGQCDVRCGGECGALVAWVLPAAHKGTGGAA